MPLDIEHRESENLLRVLAHGDLERTRPWKGETLNYAKYFDKLTSVKEERDHAACV